MSAHYGIALIPDANKNAMNVVYALWKGEDPTQSQNLSQPANASSSPDDPVLFWFGGRLYSDADLVVIQAIANNMPTASWPVTGVSGAVQLADAQAAVAAFIIAVTTQDTYTTEQAQTTLSSLLSAKGLQRVNYGD